MKVIRAEILGFCMGVRRAVEMTWRESSKKSNGAVYTFGPLIHNPAVLAALREHGVKVFDGKGCIPQNSTVIIRAHGISPAAEMDLESRRLRVLDATCPHVKRSQKKARSFAERGYTVFLAGEKNHGEIEGIRGCIESASRGGININGADVSRCFVIGNPEEAEKTGKALSEKWKNETSLFEKTALIGQTTISAGEYGEIALILRKFFPNLKAEDTICGATAARQEALKALCSRVDAVIIAGGKDSANTRRLLALAEELGKPAWLVESSDEIPREIGYYAAAGLSAGASTPDSLIAEIEKALHAL